MVVALLHKLLKAGLQTALDSLGGDVPGEVIEAVRVLLDVIEFLHGPVIHGCKTGCDLVVGGCQLLHQPVGCGSVGCGPEDIRAIRPGIEKIEMGFGLKPPDGMPVAPGILVVDLEDRLAPLLLLPLDDRYEGGAIESGRDPQARHFQHSGKHVDRGDHVGIIDGTCRGDARPADDPWSPGTVVIELGLGKRQGHAVITQEHHDRLIGVA